MLHEGQKRCLMGSRRFNVIPCGRRWGKTTMGLGLAYYGSPGAPGALAHGYDVGWFAPTYKLLDEAWRLARRFLSPFITRSDGSNHRLEIGNAAMDFWNLSEDCGRGRKYGLVIIDEAAIASDLQTAWEQAIRPTLTDYHGAAFFFSTPKGLNYFYSLHDSAPRLNDWAIYKASSYDNPHLDPMELDAMRDTMPELVYKQEILAEFVTFGAGLVKPDYLQDGPCQADLPVVLGVDLAISEREGSDWTAIVALSRDPVSGRIYLREVERHRCGFREVLARIDAAAHRWQPALIAIEQTQYQAAVVQELARSTRWPVRGIKPDRDKVTRFAPLLTRYEQRLVWHDPARVPAWFREELLSFPEGVHDDAVDAAAYAFAAAAQAGPIEFTALPGQVQGWRRRPDDDISHYDRAPGAW